MNEKLIKQLREGTIAVENDGTLDDLIKILQYAFPNDKCKIFGDCKYYSKLDYTESIWIGKNRIDLPTYSVKEFLTQEKQIMNAVVNINPDTSEINIKPKEGYEIDLENSDLKNGKVLFKKVEEKYPTEFVLDFYRHGNITKKSLSLKYAEKLDILDTLLCLRDEYNRIDGFTEGFRFGCENWCIENYNNELQLSCLIRQNRIIHFGKEETAKLFLKNFEEQLETVKEFL